MRAITSFRKYAFLSNFYIKTFMYDNHTWPTSEHAYQAEKTLNYLEKEVIRFAKTPGDAKRYGQKCTIREDWEDVKYEIMISILRQKFKFGDRMSKMLLSTQDCNIIEGNYWHDNEWGDCRCGNCKHIKGKNLLGNALMEVREELREMEEMYV